MRQVLPLHPLDFCSPEQTRQYIRNRQADAASREAAQAPEGRGLVYIKTTVTPDLFPHLNNPISIGTITCPTGLPGRFDRGTTIPANSWPKNPEAIEIDQRLMRLKRLKKNVIMSARMHSKSMQHRQHHALMVTLTYKPGVEWSAEQIADYIRRVRQWYKRKGHQIRYLWVLELTKKGRPHYHCLFWHPAGRGLSMPRADSRGWWPHGMTRTEKARNAVGYMAKYASKGDDSIMPKGARLYGVGGLEARARLERAWLNLPVGVRRWGTPADRWRRAAGGGWVCRASGEWRASLWSVLLHGGRVFAVPRPLPIESPLDALRLALSLQWQHMRF